MKGNNFPSNPLDRENIKQLTRDEIYIALYSGLYCAWEGLRAADVEGFNHNNPFEPIMNLISLGFVGLSFPRRKGREMLQVYEYRSSGEERQVIRRDA